MQTDLSDDHGNDSDLRRAGEMPLSFAGAMNNAGQKDILTVKNYDTGASLTESYTDIEHLERNTQVNTRAYGTDSSASDANGADAGSPAAAGQEALRQASILMS